MKENKKLRRKERGITLIALVITIIVLLILAGVSIAMLTGENGILTQASNAKTQQEYSSVVEGMKLAVNEYITEKKTNEITLSFVDWLKEEEREYINDDNEIQVSNLLGQSLSTGKGSGTNDVYKLEEVTETAKLASTEKVASITTEENKKYEVVYYNNKAERISIDTIEVATTEVLEETDPSLFVVNDGVLSLRDWNNYYNGKNNWTIENVVIPSEVDGKKVTAISGDMFVTQKPEIYDTIKSIVIPEGVEKITDSPYSAGSTSKCINLEQLILPSTLTYIGDNFWNYNTLKEIIVNENNPVYSAEDGVLYNKDKTQILVVPGRKEKVKIGNNITQENLESLLSGLYELKEIIVDENNPIYSTEDGILYNKYETEILVVPNKKEKVKIGDNITQENLKSLLSGLYELREIDVDGNNPVYSTEDGILCNKDKTKILVIPKRKECVIIPSSITDIESEAFSGCTSLASVEMPNSVMSIEDNAFVDCTSLSSITIPSSVSNMGSYVFSGWTEKQEIHVPFNRGEQAPSGWSEYWYSGSNATIVYAND